MKRHCPGACPGWRHRAKGVSGPMAREGMYLGMQKEEAEMLLMGSSMKRQ